MKNPELHRSIRASFGLALVLVSLWLPWAEDGRLSANLGLPHEFRGIVRGLDASVQADHITIPLWGLAVLTGWLVALSWLSQAKLMKTNVPLVLALHGASIILLISWFVKVGENGAHIGVGFLTAAVGVAFVVKAVPLDFGEVTEAATERFVSAEADPAAPETQA